MTTCCKQGHTHAPAVSRRAFIRGAGMSAVGLALAACAPKVVGPVGATGKNPTIAIAKAQTYDRALIKKQVQKMLDQIGGIADVLAHGNRVAIKVNLTGGTSTQPYPGWLEIESYLTHPEVVRATIELLRDAGAKDIFIVEAAYEPESWDKYGYTAMAKEAGATIVDLTETAPYKDYVDTSVGEKHAIYEKFRFNPILNEIDAFVSISKMKCHNVAGVTHTLKNLFGLVPYKFYTSQSSDKYRSAFHGNPNETGTRVPNIIMDLNMARPVNLGIVDGVMSSEGGEGPWNSYFSPLKPGLLFAGKDPVAVDAVATAAMGFDPTGSYPDGAFLHGQNHLNLAAGLGLGTNHLDEINVVGEKLADVTVKFKPSY